MMASIPNMRSTPLPVPTKTTQAGEPAPGGFTLEPTAPPAPATAGRGEAVVPGTATLLPVAVDPDGIAPHIVEPEGAEDGAEGQTTPPKAETKEDDGETSTAIVLPFVQQLPVVPGAPIAAKPLPAEPKTVGSDPIGLPSGTAGTGKKGAQLPEAKDPLTAEEDDGADAPDIQSAVKALLQRKPLTTKQVAATPKRDATDSAKADPVPTKAVPQQAQAPIATPATPQAAAPMPTTELPQPALSPATAQPAPAAAADKSVDVDATHTADLAVERKLDLSRDNAWLDRLARDIARAASDDSPLRFRLHPQTLGSLHVELQQGDRGAAVRMTVDTEAARQILSDAQPRLAAEARAQGVRIAETHVDLSGSGRHAPGDQRRQDEARQTPLIRTAPGAAAETANAARSARRARLDRYA